MNKDIDFITLRLKSNPAFPNPNCKLLKIAMIHPDKANTWKSLCSLLMKVDPKTKIDAKIDFSNFYSISLCNLSAALIVYSLNLLFKHNIIRLCLNKLVIYGQPLYEILHQISELSTLTEYEGDNLCTGPNFKFRGINSSNREQFKDILLLSYERRFKLNEMLDSIHGYSLTKDIKIREK